MKGLRGAVALKKIQQCPEGFTLFPGQLRVVGKDALRIFARLE